MMSTASNFPLIKNQGLLTSRRKASLLKVLQADSGRAPPPASEQRGNLHTNNKLLCPNYSVRLSSSPVLLNTKDLKYRVDGELLRKSKLQKSKQSFCGD